MDYALAPAMALRHIFHMRQRNSLLTILVLAIIGLAAATYLTQLHLQVITGQQTDFGFCDISRTISCETVSASPYSTWFNIPIAWLGAILYLFWTLLAIAGLWPRKSLAEGSIALIFCTAALALGTDIVLAGIMVFRIHSLCLLCLLTYVLNACILFLAWRAWKEPVSSAARACVTALSPFSGSGRVFFPALCLILLGITAAGAYGLRQAENSALADFNAEAFRQFSHMASRYSVDTSHDPWMGATNPELTIVEFSDFQCPHCKRAHFILQAILPSYFDHVRFVYKNLPLGKGCNPALQALPHDFHPAACALAELGEAAHIQGKFWQLHDYLFRHQHEFSGRTLNQDELLAIAARTGLDVARVRRALGSHNFRESVQADVREATRLNIHGTPAFLLNGLKINGMPPPKVLQHMIEIELRRAVRQGKG